MPNKHPLRSATADIRRLLRTADALELSAGARLRLRWFAYALAHEGNVSLTCRHFGISRSTFFRWMDRFDPKRPETLEEYSRRPHTVRKPETDARVTALVRAYRQAEPRCSKESIAQRLATEHGVQVSASTVGRIIRREGFFFGETLSHAEKRGDGAVDVLPTPAELANGEHERPQTDGGIASAAPSAIAALLAIVAATQAPEAHAAESDSYRLYDNFPMLGEGTADTSPSYMLQGGMTWLETPPLTSDSYQIVTDPPASSSSSTATSQGGGSSGGTGDSGGGPGGHRGNGSTSASTSAGGSSAPTTSSTSSEQGASSTSSSAPVAPKTSHRSVRSEQVHSAAPVTSTVTDITLPLPGEILESPPWMDPEWCVASTKCFFETVDTACPVITQYVETPRSTAGLGLHGAAPQPVSSWFFEFIVTALLFIVSVAFHWHRDRRLFTAMRYGAAATKKRSDRSRRTTMLGLLLAASIGLGALLTPMRVAAVTSAPLQHVYNGHLLTAAGAPVTTAVQIRFSYWTSADYQTGDVAVDGSINTGAATYAGWSEVHTLTPNSQGFFSVRLGSGTTLPSMSGFTLSDLVSLHLQVEVKPDNSADTSYELLDTNASETIDRSPVLSVPFALNADMLDQHDVGTGSGSIPVLGSGGTIATSQVPSGTIANRFLIDADDTEASAIVLQFGSTLAKTLSYDISNGWFVFNDDLRVQGDLTVTGLINGIDLTNIQADTGGLLRVSSGGGLNVVITGGSYRLNGELTAFGGQSGVGVTANATNYLYFGSGGLAVKTAGFPDDEAYIPLAIVTTNAGAVTNVDDRRPYLSDDREHSDKLILTPQYQGASYAGDGSDNVGQLSIQKDDSTQRNYYQWVSTQPSLQDMDVTVRVALPNDFVRFGSGITLQYRTTTADSADNAISSITVYDTAGNAATLVGSSTNLASTTWASTTLTFAGAPSWQPGGEVVIVLRMASKSTNEAHIGALTIGTVRLDRG